jgi:chromosome segregation ATPase
MPDPVELDARLDELFTAPAGEFVKAREALVRDLKREQRSEEAAEVHGLRRPTVAVWGVNQMAHARRDRVAALVEAGRELEALQQEGAGARDELRAATRTRRALLDQLTDVAASFTERPDTSRSAIAATLDAASLDPELRDDLARGRLTTELSPAVRFLGDLGDLGDGDDDDGAPAPRQRAPARSTRKSSTPPPRDDLAVRRAETALNEAQARATATDDELRDVEAETRDAEDALDAAHRGVADLEAALADARAEVKGLQRRATESKRAETRARAAQQRARTAVDVAERKVEEAKRT